MKKTIISAIVGALPVMVVAQSAVDAYSVSQSDLKGTARFVSMAGAFGALGGDLSTINQNPAGIGVYRSSEVGLTLDFDFQATKTNSMGASRSTDQTKVACSNFGYVGAVKLDSDVMPYFSWGASYSRIASFDRFYRGYIPSLSTSMSNYIANFTNDGGWTDRDLLQSHDYDPYWGSNAPWLSILGANSQIINSVGNSYNGLFQDGVSGDASYWVKEKGYVDEYSINFGGNIMNTVYWGVALGITDISYTQAAYYDEVLNDVQVLDGYNSVYSAQGDFMVDNYKHTSGNGYNFKAGVILKPINELRFGLAVHSPTYYELRNEMWGAIDAYFPVGEDQYFGEAAETDEGYITCYDSEFNTPWRLIASVAGVVGGRAILSADYEYVSYDDMRVKDQHGDEYYDVTGDIKNCYKAQNIIRIGGEFRVTPQFSVRAGYSYQSSPVNEVYMNNDRYMYTAGTNPAYTLDNTTQYITCGLGYKYHGFYVDLAYVHKYRESEYRPFSSFGQYDDYLNEYSVIERSPVATVKDNNNRLIMSIGYKF